MQCTITSPRELHNPHALDLSVPSAAGLAFYASKIQIYAFTIKTLNLNCDTTVNTELHWVQLFIQYIRLVTTLMLEKVPRGIVYCHAVRYVCVLLNIVLMSWIIASGWLPSRWLWGPMKSGFAYDWELRVAAWSPPEGRTYQLAALFSRGWARAWSLSSRNSKQRMGRWNVIGCGRELRLRLEAFQSSSRFVLWAWSYLLAEYCRGTL